MKKTVVYLLTALLLLSLPWGVWAAGAASSQGAYREETLRGAWLASVYNIDFPSPKLSASEQKAELCKKLDVMKATGLNTVFFQVRPTADALYRSSIYPTSQWVVGTQGKDCGYDPLQFMIDEGKKRGIEVHAWINPYRITVGSPQSPGHDLSKLDPKNPARLHPEWTVNFGDGRMYFDPGYPEVAQLVVDGVRVIIRNYDVAGIHFDDYFYPTAHTKNADGKTVSAVFDDSRSFALYGNGRTLADYRRDNTYHMVQMVNDAIKAEKPAVSFGISPFGVWANKGEMPGASETNGGYSSYVEQYADTRKWVKDGILDYIAPQLYWPIGADKTDYEVLVNWWSDTVKDTKVKLYVGHAAYKVGDAGQDGKWQRPEELVDQVRVSRGTGQVSGCIFYGLSCFEENRLGAADRLKDFFARSGVVEELNITYPAEHIGVNQKAITLLGTADPEFPLFCNGQEVAVTPKGLFAFYTPLKPGENSFQFVQNGQGYTHRVVRETLTLQSDLATQTALGEGWMVLTGNEKLTLSFVAPKGASVQVSIGGKNLRLQEGQAPAGSTMATYSGTFVATDIVESGLQFVGKPIYEVTKDGKTTKKEINTRLFVYGREREAVATVMVDDTAVYAGPSAQSERLAVYHRGVTDNVVEESKEFYRLAMGGWVRKNAVAADKLQLPLREVTDLRGRSDSYETNVAFAMPYYAPYQLKVDGEKAELTLFDAKGMAPKKLNDWSTLFQDVSFVQGKDAVYTFTLKQYQGFYGYRVCYRDGELCFVFQNPVRARTGDRPLGGISVLLDPGHGGEDPGAIGPGGTERPVEKELNLQVALYLREELQKLGAEVQMTREKDETVPLLARQQKITDQSPDIAISVHHNSVDSARNMAEVSGMLTLYTTDFSKPLAQTLQQALVGALSRKDEGVRPQNLAVCRATDCPSVLLELGYLCNPTEYEFLSQDTTMRAEAKAAAQGILDYFS